MIIDTVSAKTLSVFDLQIPISEQYSSKQILIDEISSIPVKPNKKVVLKAYWIPYGLTV